MLIGLRENRRPRRNLILGFIPFVLILEGLFFFFRRWFLVMAIMMIGTGAIVFYQVFGHAFEKGDIYNTSVYADGRL